MAKTQGLVIIALLGFVASPSMAQSSYGSGSGRSGGYPTYGTGSNPSSNSVGGYTTRDGNYVSPHQRTNPNGTQYDNYGSRGNTNPYSGQTGKRSPKW